MPSHALQRSPPEPVATLTESLPVILVVDDDPTTRLLAERVLVTQGFRVLHAPRLRDARAVLDTTKVALVLIDGLLPDGTGLELITELRRSGHGAA